MAQNAAEARNGTRFTAAVARGLRESAAIAIAVLALVVLVALVTYSPDDPGFSRAAGPVDVHNSIGPVGAWFADLLFFLFGRPALDRKRHV